MPPECQQLLRSLEQATARLADLHPQDVGEVQHALAERSRAIDAMAGWIAAEGQASRRPSPELAGHLDRDLEIGAEILVRLALDREATRLDLAKLGRERQILRSLSNTGTRKPTTIDQQG